jgi:transposase
MKSSWTSDQGKYALVIQDFYTGDPIDVLRSRRNNVTEPYFVSLPVEERNNVKYLLTDMYNPYLLYIDKYFPNAVPVSYFSTPKTNTRFISSKLG